MPEVRTHPSAQALALFGNGKLPQAQAVTVAAHLETCADCRQAVAGLPPDSFLGKVQAARPGGSSLLPGDSPSGAGGLPAPAAPPADLPPELADHPKFRVVRELGRGGMGVIYLAEHRVMDKPVALKVINAAVLDNSDTLARFRREVQAAGRLDHQNIARAYDADQAGDLHFLVMEFVEGISLAQLLEKKGPLPVAHACHYARQAALGLQHAFEQGMAHRDVKPQNLMLTPRGLVKILDFGLVRVHSEPKGGHRLTRLESFMGTPPYVAPEQAIDARKADTRSDIYGLGCTLYALLAGRPPFAGHGVAEIVLAHIETTARPLHEVRPDVPPDLSAVVAKMLAKDPNQRHQRPAEVAQALAPFTKAGGEPAGPDPVSPAPARPGATGSDTVRVRTPDRDVSRLPTRTAESREERGSPFAGLTDNVAPPQKAEARHPAAAPRRSRGRQRWPLLAVAGGALGLLVVGVVLSIHGPDGAVGSSELRAEAGPTKEATPRTSPAPTTSKGPEETAGAVLPDKGTPPEGGGETVKAAPPEAVAPVGGGGDTAKPAPPEVVVPAAGKGEPAKAGMPEKGKPATPLKEVTNALGMKLVLVPRGSFWMGHRGSQEQTTIPRDFYIGTYPATQGQWQDVMGANPSCFSHGGGGADKVKGISAADLKQFPVENVSWDDVQGFLKRLNAREKAKGLVYRLPTEAEREYACRGGATSQEDCAFDYYFSDPTNDLSSEQANFDGNSPGGDAPKGKRLGRTTKVGSYKPNRLGLYDMHGNVCEWCADHVMLDVRSFRVVMGGGWTGTNLHCRAANRNYYPPSHMSFDTGFRLVASPPGEQGGRAGAPP